MIEHRHRKLAHQRFGLQMQVTKHGIAVPSTQHAYSAVVDAATHECHGAARAEGSGTDVGVLEARLVRRGDGCQSKSRCDVCGFDDNALVVAEVRGEGRGVGDFVVAEVKDTSNCGFDGARHVICAESVRNDLTLRAIFLCIKRYRDKGGGV
jgi:hypothetical protein